MAFSVSKQQTHTIAFLYWLAGLVFEYEKDDFVSGLFHLFG